MNEINYFLYDCTLVHLPSEYRKLIYYIHWFIVQLTIKWTIIFYVIVIMVFIFGTIYSF